MFSQTVEYALRAMMLLASLEGAPMTSERIAARTRVPPGYLSKVMRSLVLGKLVASSRGPGGGFVLSAGPAQISILDVVQAVDPIRRIHACPMDNPEHTQLCPLHRSLDRAIGEMEKSFARTTLAQMLAGEGTARATDAPDLKTPAPGLAALPRPDPEHL